MKAVVIGALAATAYSADTILIPGTYKVVEEDATNDATNCCLPTAAGVTVAADGTDYRVSFTFPATCPGDSSRLGGQTVTDSGTLTSNEIEITDTIASVGVTWTLGVPANANEDFTLDLGNGPSTPATCLVTLGRVPTTLPPAYTGVYEVKTKHGVSTAQCCYPTGDIVLRQAGAAGTDVDAEWTFAAAGTDCAGTGAALAGTSVSATGTPNAVSGAVDLVESPNTWGITYAPNIAVDSGILLNIGAGANPTDCAVSIAKKTLPTVAYTGIYESTDNGGTDATCCYPAGDVTVTADGTQYNVAWTFGEEAGCPAALKGQAISAKATPDIATKDVTITQTLSSTPYSFTLEYPATATGDWSLDLSAINSACSATLEKKSGYLVGLGSLVALSLSYLMF